MDKNNYYFHFYNIENRMMKLSKHTLHCLWLKWPQVKISLLPIKLLRKQLSAHFAKSC